MIPAAILMIILLGATVISLVTMWASNRALGKRVTTQDDLIAEMHRDIEALKRYNAARAG